MPDTTLPDGEKDYLGAAVSDLKETLVPYWQTYGKWVLLVGGAFVFLKVLKIFR